eukprot:6005685-Amphidinium_carterae.1
MAEVARFELILSEKRWKWVGRPFNLRLKALQLMGGFKVEPRGPHPDASVARVTSALYVCCSAEWCPDPSP